MAKKKKKGKRNPFRRRNATNGNGGRSSNLYTFGERVLTEGGSAVVANALTAHAANRWMRVQAGANEEAVAANQRNKVLARAAVQIYGGWKLRNRFPRIGAGIAIGGAIAVVEHFAGRSINEQAQRLFSESTTTTTTGGGGEGTRAGALGSGNDRIDDDGYAGNVERIGVRRVGNDE